ncbi:MAG: UDP-glucose/GDP-mannose dehydrogenase family protein [Akkermansia muciniphila]|nr:UDP-glucose/GDP-mannose dehydrogenase family protein [Akkermansia muciniphila]
MNLAIIGTGYVGLTTGTCFAEVGHNVICVDNNANKVAMLRNGKMPIYEPDLEEMIVSNVSAGRLHFSTDLADAIHRSEIIFIAVPTPPHEDGSVDLSYIEEVSHAIADTLSPKLGYRIIVDKSTVPVSTGDRVSEVIARYAPDEVDVDVVSNPEFLREGSAVSDLMNPDRVVIGADSQRAMDMMKRVYQPFNAPIVEVDLPSAEMIKHAANSFLALKISYINAVSAVCEKAGADVEQVAKGIGMDKRISRHFLNAGLGYGGSCFPKDVKGFINIADKLGAPLNILKEVEHINNRQCERFIDRIRQKLWVLRNKRIAVWGIAFKQNTDDVRESVAVKLIRRLCEEGAVVTAYDPKAAESGAMALQGCPVTICRDMYECTRDAEVLVVATEWRQFAMANLPKVRELMRLPIIFDGRNIIHGENAVSAGFEYHSIGRKSLYPAK